MLKKEGGLRLVGVGHTVGEDERRGEGGGGRGNALTLRQMDNPFHGGLTCTCDGMCVTVCSSVWLQTSERPLE